MLIREMRSEDKPRERFQESPKMASMTDLVAILLRTGRQGYSVMQLAQDVVDQLEQTVGINGYEDLHWRVSRYQRHRPDKQSPSVQRFGARAASDLYI